MARSFLLILFPARRFLYSIGGYRAKLPTSAKSWALGIAWILQATCMLLAAPIRKCDDVEGVTFEHTIHPPSQFDRTQFEANCPIVHLNSEVTPTVSTTFSCARTAPDSNRTGRTILKFHFAIRDLTIQALTSAVPQDMKISIWRSNREGRFCSGRGDEHASQ